MTAAGWITMVIVLGVAWGGFALTLVLAIRRESAKRKSGDS
jgi:hypothetical protein